MGVMSMTQCMIVVTCHLAQCRPQMEERHLEEGAGKVEGIHRNSKLGRLKLGKHNLLGIKRIESALSKSPSSDMQKVVYSRQWCAVLLLQ